MSLTPTHPLAGDPPIRQRVSFFSPTRGAIWGVGTRTWNLGRGVGGWRRMKSTKHSDSYISDWTGAMLVVVKLEP